MILYLSNDERKVHLRMATHVVSYKGPAPLVRFVKVNDFNKEYIAVDCEFRFTDRTVSILEDYIDLYHVFGKKKRKLLNSLTGVEIEDKLFSGKGRC